MGTQRWQLWVMATAAATLSACVGMEGDVEGGDEDLGGAESQLSSENMLSQNALSSNKISANKISANKISANKISANSLQFNTAPDWDKENTPEGRELLRYLAKCALPAGVNLVNGSDVYPGLLGLAPGWENNPLTAKERRAVSACLGAHTNYFGKSVPISVRWNTVTDNGEVTTYFSNDATFFGDYFDPNGQIYACKMPGTQTSPNQYDRVCDDQSAAGSRLTKCGFTIPAYGGSGSVPDCSLTCQSWKATKDPANLAHEQKYYYNCWTGTGYSGTMYGEGETMGVYLKSQ